MIEVDIRITAPAASDIVALLPRPLSPGDTFAFSIAGAPIAGDLASAKLAPCGILAPNFVKVGADGKRLSDDAGDWVAVEDLSTGLMWSRYASDRMDWKKADAFAKACRSAGFTDWRLPTVRELQSIVDHTRHEPAIDTRYFPDTPAEWFWTSTPAAWSPESDAWVVNFYLGNASTYYRDNDYRVRAVRSVAAAASQ